MENIFASSMIRLIQRFSIILALGCCVYVIFSIFLRGHDNSMPVNKSIAPAKSINLVSPLPVFDLKPYNTSTQARDLFSLNMNVSPTGVVENTPKGTLPDHLKVVGILIDHPSQVVIEDGFTNKTYFINEGETQAGIKIVQISPNQMIINYQGQSIPIPVGKN